MPAFCCVINCGSRAERDNVKFYRIPKSLNFKYKTNLNNLSAERRYKWINAIKRQDFTESKLKNARICSKHFITGVPAKLSDSTNPDWVPTLNMGYKTSVQESAVLARYERVDKRRKLLDVPELIPASVEEDECQPGTSTMLKEEPDNCKATQTDLTSEQICDLFLSLNINKKLNAKLNSLSFSLDSFKDNLPKTKYYTGLDSFNKLCLIIKLIEPFIKIHHNTSLSAQQQIILTLIKLRLNLDFTELSYKFNVSQSSVSTYFKNVISIMYDRFKKLIIWPDRDILKKTLPGCFKSSFGDKATVIIDCFEIYIEKPSNLLTGAQCWSNYKHNYTLKYLIGITPQCSICFISEGWGGRASDKHITQNSTFLNNILPGDVVLADRGFLISELLHILSAKVNIPAFTRGKSQLHPTEIESTRSLAYVRIHVERVIGTIRQKYRILSDTMPLSLISVMDNNELIVDKIVTVACALVNICDPILL